MLASWASPPPAPSAFQILSEIIPHGRVEQPITAAVSLSEPVRLCRGSLVVFATPVPALLGAPRAGCAPAPGCWIRGTLHPVGVRQNV